MIKIAIKHKLYELAIDALFDSLMNNFMEYKCEFKIGDTFNTLVFQIKLVTGEYYIYYLKEVEVTRRMDTEYGELIFIKYKRGNMYSSYTNEMLELTVTNGSANMSCTIDELLKHD